MEKCNQLELFAMGLPDKPYCTNDFQFGLVIKAAQDAIKRKYIQANKPWLKTWLIYDVDRDGAAYEWQWIDSCPTPNIIVENKANGHAHLFYGLEYPVNVYDRSGTKAARYAAAIDYAIMKKLEADPGYTAFTAKNPLHRHWQVSVRQEYLYTLDWLADYLDLDDFDARKRPNNYGIGRNVTLFNILRLYAYRAVKNYWHDRKRGFQAFYDDLAVKAAFANNNEFGVDNCLMYPEVKHIIKSVASWTWRNFTPEAFAERQKQRNLRSQQKRRAEADKKRQILFAFMNDNPTATQKDAAKHLGVNERTVRRYLEIHKNGDLS